MLLKKLSTVNTILVLAVFALAMGFIICNTDNQALEASAIPNKVQLGEKGLGAGSIPDVGREAATQNVEGIKQILEKNTKMLFITAGMGGGTGTGAAPVIAKIARDMDILTVGIVTLPFSFEGRKRKMQADTGIEELRNNVDSLLIICNDKLREVHGDLKLSEAFEKADSILSVAAKGIAEIITVTGYINVDFEDVRTVMKESGTAIMGSGSAEGESRAIKAVEEALSSPLLNDNLIKGTDNILLYLASGDEELTMDEVTEITDYIQDEAGQNAEIIWGNGFDKSLGNKISITLVATGFVTDESATDNHIVRRKVHTLTDGPREEVIKPKPRVTKPITEITLLNEIEEKEITDELPGIVNEVVEEAPIAPSFDFSVGEGITSAHANTTVEAESKPDVKEDNPITEIQRITPPRDYSLNVEQHEIEKKSSERIQKLKELSIKLKSPQEIDHMESTPAYLRRNVELSDVKPSSESEVSKFTLGEDEDKNSEIKTNNSFLHDNVD